MGAVAARGTGHDLERRKAAGVPDEVGHVTKSRLALVLEKLADRLESEPVIVADCGYGRSVSFRLVVEAGGRSYVMAVDPKEIALGFGQPRGGLPCRAHRAGEGGCRSALAGSDEESHGRADTRGHGPAIAAVTRLTAHAAARSNGPTPGSYQNDSPVTHSRPLKDRG
jgi:hypothetical protein